MIIRDQLRQFIKMLIFEPIFFLRYYKIRRARYSWWKSIYFHHIGKTAGTSYTSFLKPLVKDSEFCPTHIPNREVLSHLEKYRFVAGHFPFIFNQIMPQPCATITILREPKKRVISGFNHLKRQKGKHNLLSHRNYNPISSFDDFLNDDVLRSISSSMLTFSIGRNDLSIAELINRVRRISRTDKLATIPPNPDLLYLLRGKLAEDRNSNELLNRAKDRLFNQCAAYGIVEMPDESKSYILGVLGFDLNLKAPPRKNTAKDQMDNFITIDDLSHAQKASLSDMVRADDILYKEACQVLRERSAIKS